VPLPRFIAALSLAALVGCDVAAMAGPEPGVDLTARADAPARPLIFLDGRLLAPDFDLSRIAREDVVSIEVVKSPAAVTRYGAAAAAGVIHIATRAGR
jgi:outer membrane cobalamin receptor